MTKLALCIEGVIEKNEINALLFPILVFRFNKLGLDEITAGKEPNPTNQVEEVHSYTPVQSHPLTSEKIVYIDIGTAHSVAVTGKIFNFMSDIDSMIVD